MPFTYLRTVHFADTDAAGVVYFARVLSMCHEAYEAALADQGVDLKTFFQDRSIALPIVHAEVDLMQPMFCGESYAIGVTPQRLSAHKFALEFVLAPPALAPLERDAPDAFSQKLVGRAKTIHVCIHPLDRTRRSFPPVIEQWLTAQMGLPPTPQS